ncbi:PIN domain-containing protein [Breznakiellaceae bacterium SP9]
MKISIITMMELVLGARNKKEIANMKNAFKKIEIVHIDEKISELAYDFIYQYNKSHSLFINDAIIAATAVINNTTLVTLNISDFKFIPGISIYINYEIKNNIKYTRTAQSRTIYASGRSSKIV